MVRTQQSPRWPSRCALEATPPLGVFAAVGLLAVVCPVALAAHRPAPSIGLPAAACQPYGTVPCLLPFPDDRLTRPDSTSFTGVRLQLPAAAMPVNRSGERIAVGAYDRNDGFSPGSTVIAHVPGLDNAQAFARTAPVGLADMSAAFASEQPIVIIDERSAGRQLIWSELDATATSRQSTNLLIHPARALTEGHTYVIALRNLRAANGRLLAAPGWFERLRDRRRLQSGTRSQRARYARIFAALGRAGIPRASLYAAWDFTVASTAALTSRLLGIRNDAFAQLGDHDLAGGTPHGQAPAFAVTSTDQLTPGLRRLQGTFEVPCYEITCTASATSPFHYRSGLPDALPSQLPGNVAHPEFECLIPSSASASHPARISLYGHGFLGSRAEIESGWVQQLATEYNIAFCASDWWGLAGPDLPSFIQTLRDVNDLPAQVDRIQQGVLNMLYLGRLMRHPLGFASQPDFQDRGRALIDTSHLYFDGNSAGGILGGVLTAVAPDVGRAVLGVTGMDFFNLMVPRGLIFSSFGKFVLRNYRDHSLHPLVLDLLQQLWDRGDPDGYAAQMTSQPLPQTPAHTVLMQIAYGDLQVSMYAAAVQARTIGASAPAPALDAGNDRARDAQLLFGIPAISSFPFTGSALVLWDSGPGRSTQPPLENLPPPPPGPTNQDPHGDPRATEAAQHQISDFLTPDGAVVDVCSGQPCHSSTYTP